MRKKRTRGTSTTTAQEKVTVTAQKKVMNAPAEETHHNPSPIYQSYNTDNGNENQS